MGAVAFQITSLTIVFWTVYLDTDERKHQSSASLAFVWGIHRGPVNSPHKWPVTRKMFPFDDVIMNFCYQAGCIYGGISSLFHSGLPFLTDIKWCTWDFTLLDVILNLGQIYEYISVFKICSSWKIHYKFIVILTHSNVNTQKIHIHAKLPLKRRHVFKGTVWILCWDHNKSPVSLGSE